MKNDNILLGDTHFDTLSFEALSFLSIRYYFVRLLLRIVEIQFVKIMDFNETLYSSLLHTLFCTDRLKI